MWTHVLIFGVYQEEVVHNPQGGVKTAGRSARFLRIAVQHIEKVFSNKMVKLSLKVGLSPRPADADVQVEQAALGGACNLLCDNYVFPSRLSDV